MHRQDKQLNDLLAKYTINVAKASRLPSSKAINIELELRFKRINRETFKVIYGCIINDESFTDPKLECTVDIINTASDSVTPRNRVNRQRPGRGGNKPKPVIGVPQQIRKYTFKGPKMISDTYHTKTSLAEPVYVGQDRFVSISQEAVVDPFTTSTSALMRFKVRASFMYRASSGSQWRFDLTAVKKGTLNDLGPMLKDIKDNLFTDALTATNLLTALAFDTVDTFEIEAEHMPSSSPPSSADITSIVALVASMIDPSATMESAYQEEIYRVATYIMRQPEQFKQPNYRLKQLSTKVVSMTKAVYYNQIYPHLVGMYLTIKTDGQRAIVTVDGAKCRIIRSDTMLEYIRDNTSPGPITIADVEYVADAAGGQPALYVFDVIVINGKNVAYDGFEVRVTYLEAAANAINSALSGTHPIGSNTIPQPQAIAKTITRIEPGTMESVVRSTWEATYPYPRDGLILIAPSFEYKRTNSYKWKPQDKNTIDFLAVKCPNTLLGIKPYLVKANKDLYLLFVGIKDTERERLGVRLVAQYKSLFPSSSGGDIYRPIQFSPSSDPFAYLYWHDVTAGSLDRKIVELSRTADNSEWIYHGLRTDRALERNYLGNDYRTAEATFINFADPFKLEDLWKPSTSYFTKVADDMYTASNRYKRFVISALLRQYMPKFTWIIDLGSGRGADLHRYQNIGVSNVLFMDIDATALNELTHRRLEDAATERKKKGWTGGATMEPGELGFDYDKVLTKSSKGMTVYTLVANLKDPAAELIADTYQFGINPGIIDGMVCNFALHYMCDTEDHMRNLLIFVTKMLKQDGLFMFTVMDGSSVFNILKPLSPGQQWKVYEGEVLKYAIERSYVATKLTTAGQMISVLLPFSNKMYEEPLCNVDAFVSIATKLGLKKVVDVNMLSMLDEFSTADSSTARVVDKLTSDDRNYIGLHRCVILRKDKQHKPTSSDDQ